MMDWLRGLLLRVKALVFRREADQELEEELRLHIEMETEAGVGRGLAPEEARRQALVRFGGVERFKEATREARKGRLLDGLARDLRLALRQLRTHPAFTLAAVATLALGIGANTAIFSVVDAVLLRPSPFPEPDRLVVVWETDRSSGTRHEPASWPDVADYRRRARTLSAVGAVAGADLTLTGQGEPERVAALIATPSVLDVMGVQPLLGRAFTADEGTAGSPPYTVLLSEGFWRRRFDADPQVVGRTLTLDEGPATVVGVLPSGADLGLAQVDARADYGAAVPAGRADMWVAARPTEEAFPRETHPFFTLARLAPGVSLASAQDELGSIAADLESTYTADAHRGVNLEAYGDVVFGPVRPALLVLLGAVALVLLVACANVANLFLARTTGRVREVAVRRALGAGAGQIRRQFVVESLVLTGLGTLAGVGLAYGGLHALVAMAPADIPRLADASLDGRVLAATAGVAALVAAVFAVLPAVQVRRLALQPMLRSQAGPGAGAGRGGRRLRSALVVGEIATAVTLVIGAGLLLRSFWSLRSVDPGFDARHVLQAEYQLPASRYPLDFSRWPKLPEINGFHAALLDEVRALPGVTSAALASASPIDPGYTNSFVVVGSGEGARDHPEIRTRSITPGYLETVKLPLLEGRGIEAGDVAGAPPVGLVNRAAARRYLPGGALGREISFWGTDWRIVGVVGDERFRGLDQPSEPAIYVPLAQSPQQTVTLLVRSEGDLAALAEPLRRSVAKLDPAVALSGVEPLAAALSGSVSEPRFTATLLGLFAALAILLALIGVHGVLAYTVAERSAETGIRMALGASRGDVLRSVVGEGMALAGVGVALGLAAALAGSRLLASLLFGVAPRDPDTYAGVVILVLGVAALASLVPALRATRADPVASLRAE